MAAQPTLATLRRDDREIPAVLIGTKMGFVFALERETGKPIFPIEERPVPTSDVPGEQLSPTQPIPLAPPPLVPQSLKPEDAWGLVYFDRIACRDRIAALRSEGLYTPPSLQGTMLFPFSGGGVNWGGGAFDPGRSLYIVNGSRIAHAVKLIPRADYAAAHAADPKVEIGRGLGTPYAARREVLLSPLGLPCNPPPWGTLAALDMNAGTINGRCPSGCRPMVASSKACRVWVVRSSLPAVSSLSQAPWTIIFGLSTSRAALSSGVPISPPAARRRQ